ncbi:MAG TPA: hypothetical protein VMT19_12140 [Thermoanaerobaculaceae bacterium]|nr:hypothetical protein [Thermoanaerobaculaceae bacterium]
MRSVRFSGLLACVAIQALAIVAAESAEQQAAGTRGGVAAALARLRAEGTRPTGDPGLAAVRAELERDTAEALAAQNRQVAAALERVQARLQNPRGPVPAPAITGVVQSPPLSPGEQILILGEGFGGPDDGSVTPPPGGVARLNGYFAGGHLQLEIVRWAPAYVLARVPIVTHVPDQGLVTVQVVVGTSASNQVDSAFEAARGVVLVRREDTQVMACHGADLAANFCNPGFGRHTSASFGAYHAYTDGECGRDELRVALTHQFTLHRAYLDAVPGYQASGSAGPPAFAASLGGFQPGAAAADISVEWCYDGIGGLDYGLALYAVGPAGFFYR